MRFNYLFIDIMIIIALHLHYPSSILYYPFSLSHTLYSLSYTLSLFSIIHTLYRLQWAQSIVAGRQADNCLQID